MRNTGRVAALSLLKFLTIAIVCALVGMSIAPGKGSADQRSGPSSPPPSPPPQAGTQVAFQPKIIDQRRAREKSDRHIVRAGPVYRGSNGAEGLPPPGTIGPLAEVLAPDVSFAGGLTTERAPRLYWYYGGRVRARVHVAMVNATDQQDVLDEQLGEVSLPGVYEIALSRYANFSLIPGKGYIFSVTVEVPGSISTERQAYIELAPISGADDAAKCADEICVAQGRAGAGYWYDAIQQVADRLKRAPNDPQALTLWRGLLDSVELGALSNAPLR